MRFWDSSALVPIVLVVLVILTLAPGPILAAESKKQDAPGDFEQRFAEGVRLHDAGQYDAAIAVYRDLLKDYPKNPRVLYELAFSSLSGGKPKDAVDHAARCLKQHSKYDSECHQIMGNAYDDLGEHTHEPVLGDPEGRPAKLAVVFEPVVCGFVMGVIGMEEGDEDVDVQQRRKAHASSRSSFTSFRSPCCAARCRVVLPARSFTDMSAPASSSRSAASV